MVTPAAVENSFMYFTKFRQKCLSTMPLSKRMDVTRLNQLKGRLKSWNILVILWGADRVPAVCFQTQMQPKRKLGSAVPHVTTRGRL